MVMFAPASSLPAELAVGLASLLVATAGVMLAVVSRRTPGRELPESAGVALLMCFVVALGWLWLGRPGDLGALAGICFAATALALGAALAVMLGRNWFTSINISRSVAAVVRRVGRWPVVVVAAGVASALFFGGGTPSPVPAAFSYPITGVTIAGGAYVQAREGPGAQFRAVGPKLHDGDLVAVVCWTYGGRATGTSSRRWLRTTRDTFISEGFVDTAREARPPVLPRCERERHA